LPCVQACSSATTTANGSFSVCSIEAAAHLGMAAQAAQVVGRPLQQQQLVKPGGQPAAAAVAVGLPQPERSLQDTRQQQQQQFQQHTGEHSICGY
jgi:hypothetical protein